MAKSRIPSLEDLDRWLSEGKRKKVIGAVEAVPAAQRSPRHTLLLGIAYFQSTDLGLPESRQQLQRVLSLLEPLQSAADDLIDPFYWYHTMGSCLYYLDRTSEALPYIQKAYDLGPDRPNIQDVLQLCQSALNRPKARWPFREGVKRAWEAFLEQQPAMLQQLEEEQPGQCSEKLEDMVVSCMQFAFAEPDVSVWKTEGKPRLVFDVRVSRFGILQIQALLRQAPAAVRAVWDFQYGPLPDRKSPEVRKYLRIYGDARVQLYTDGSGEIAAADIMGLPFVMSPQQFQILSTIPGRKEAVRYLRPVVGQVPFLRLSHMYNPDMRPGPAVTLRNLSQTLSDHGLDCSEASAGKVLEPQLYRTDKKIHVKAWRALEETGVHRFPALLENINERFDFFSDGTVQDGVEGGYLVWPIGSSARKNTVPFQQELQAKLLETAGEDCLTPLGHGTDACFAYLDFIA